MHNIRFTRGAALLAVLASLACGSLDVVNPNNPDAKRALADPAALEGVAGGTLRTFINTFDANEGNIVLLTQAQSYSASWNNYNMNFYSSIDADGTRNSRPWQNDPAAAGRTSIEGPWTGYYSTLSSATDVLTAIRVNGIEFSSPSATKRAETIAVLMQGAAMMQIALMYDKGYIVDETVDLATLDYSDRKAMRDAALAKLDDAIALANANSFTTLSSWTNGYTYTNTQISRLASTMAAMTLAMWPRNAAENAAVDWARVASYASNGLTSDILFNGDGCVAWCHELYYWFNAVDTGRISTRVANMLDPASQTHPWPAGGNGPPNSPDKRLGDGSFGTPAMVDDWGNIPKTANAGTDFMWTSVKSFNSARGDYHQSNLGHIRYDLTGEQDPSGIWGGFGVAPFLTATLNDLLWAEGLIRSGGSMATAATLINKSRVTRGGLTPAAAGDGATLLTTRLQYEQEIELLGIGSINFLNRRRIDGLLTGTPHEMPVPAKELGVFGQALYTWGGSANPASSPTPP
ncbi:MAG: hypothetical protein O2973_11080 [Gemmatimonadetes bacterium]|nr:hypothetical protein [Gemmatimonadota bacterium]